MRKTYTWALPPEGTVSEEINYGAERRSASDYSLSDPTVLDLILDFKLCMDMRDSLRNSGYEITDEVNERARDNEIARRYTYERTTLLNALAHSTSFYNWDDEGEDVDVNEPPIDRLPRQDEDSDQVKMIRLLERLRNQVYPLSPSSAQELRDEFEDILFGDNPTEIFDDIASYDPRTKKKPNRAKVPYYLLEKLAMTLGEEYRVRREIVRYTHQGKKYQGSYLTCQMILSDSEYFGHVYSIVDSVNSTFMSNITAYLSPPAPTASYPNAIAEMRKVVNNSKVSGYPLFGKYKEYTGKSCFGLLEIGNHHLFSLSNTFDIPDHKPYNKALETYMYASLDCGTIASYNDLRHKIEDANIAGRTGCKQACFNENIIRYNVYDAKTKSRISITPESVKDCVARGVSAQDISSDFSCCERKMLSYVPTITSAIQGCIFSKFKPCRKCEPAIDAFNVGPGKLDVYYLDNDVMVVRKV